MAGIVPLTVIVGHGASELAPCLVALAEAGAIAHGSGRCPSWWPDPRSWRGHARNGGTPAIPADGVVIAVGGRDGTADDIEADAILRPASWVSGAVVVDHRLARDQANREAARTLALTRLAWEEIEAGAPPQLQLLAPAPRRLARALLRAPGRNALVLPAAPPATDAWMDLRAALPGWQFHAGMDAPALPGVERWALTRALRWALLGKVNLVVADPGPLAWDAQRAGIPTRPWSPAAGPAGDASVDLADMLTAGLTARPSTWLRVARTLAGARRDGTPLPPAMGPTLLGPWLERRPAVGPDATSLLWRRTRKLMRDPAGFCQDSQNALLRWFARNPS